MTYNQFLLKTILFNYRKYLAYFFCVTFSMFVFFLFTTIWFTPDFTEQTSRGMKQIVQIGGILATAFSLFIITYSYQNFFKGRTKEFAILMSYGLLYRDMRTMIIVENSFIFLVALISAFISGSIFSKLFFMVVIAILNINTIPFSLTIRSFIWTFFIFFPIYLLIIGISIYKMKKYSITKLLKEHRLKEMKHQTRSVLFAICGIGLIVATMLFLNGYTSDFANVATMRQAIIISIVICVAGLYLLIHHFTCLIYVIWKKKKEPYLKNILNITEFSSNFSQNRSIIFTVSLLSMGIIFFSTLTLSLYNHSFDIVEKEQLFDVVVKDYEVLKILDQQEVKEIATTVIIEPFEQQQLSVVYVEAPMMKHTPWRTNKRIIVTSDNQFNQVFSTNFNVEQSAAKIIDFNQGDSASIPYFEETIFLNHDHGQYTFSHQETKQMKLFDRYVFNQPILMIISEEAFLEIKHNAVLDEIGVIHLFKFSNWKNSGEFVALLKETVEKNVHSADMKFRNIIEKKNHYPFIVQSKYDRYAHTKEVAGFALFIMSFISFLFIVTVFVVLYFKIFADREDDQKKLKQLQAIGFTSAETSKYLNNKLKMIIVLPIFIGSIIGLCLTFVMNFANVAEMELVNTTILLTGFKVVGFYYAAITIYYFWLKIIYKKTVMLERKL
ncbi:FtsX-like permease family protein [Anaerobacillus isosaccharinicus]|uniref:ABC transporter permease n=1 Tax=Anaerobacillus isosaccharinicus TaxID=1532552 RepID=A0A1S2LVW9_9BACI|nr:ABC transporter permease [Anaerobacillus isosaccharinicus]MBA5588409.1 ABC transporter permease [Anaerobacillus isosaccharinicus]QOY38160.1 ABC transporter permease [Anaerobacillus isosaccharinicus]